MSKMTLATARNIADTPSVSDMGQRIPVARLVEASQVLDQRGRGDGRDGRRLRAMAYTIDRRRAVSERDARQASEWNRINVGAAFQYVCGF